MINATNLVDFVGGGMLSTVGSEILLGIITLALLMYFVFKSGGGLGTAIILVIPVILILSSASFGFFPDWLFSIILVGVGLLFSTAIIKLLVGGK